MDTNHHIIPQLLRQLADALEKPKNKEMTELLSPLVRNLSYPQISPINIPQNVEQQESVVEFEVAKGKNYLVVMMIWLMVRKGWIKVKDSKTGKEINIENASQWFYQKLFGKPIKKWNQVLQYIFRWRTETEKTKFLKVFDDMKNLVNCRIKKD